MWQLPPTDPTVPDPLVPPSPKKHKRPSSPPKAHVTKPGKCPKEDECLPTCSTVPKSRSSHVLLKPAADISILTNILTRRPSMSYHVVRHHNQVVALADTNNTTHVTTLHHQPPSHSAKKKRKPKQQTSSHLSEVAKHNMDKLQLAKVLGNERMALMWAQLEDEFAWVEPPPL
ncbi:hypothetical protein DYB26_006086 [Aphanomyces astaci]|uniref:Uncharacterized protein n=1 Tax=Aphanomyces astaci TaxID=112090 RepID=A0A3R7C3N0_APHAT|nr:hypothetical protein DYB26_006086 [Aphanomyces astaci]